MKHFPLRSRGPPALEPGSEPQARALPREDLCAGIEGCRFRAAMRREGDWWLLLEGDAEGERIAALAPVAGDGEPVKVPEEAVVDLHGLVDFTAAGHLASAVGLRWTLAPSGRVEPRSAPSSVTDSGRPQPGYYRSVGGRLERASRWEIPDARAVAHIIGDDMLVASCPRDEEDNRLRIGKAIGDEHAVLSADLSSDRACGKIVEATLVPAADDSDGYLVAVPERVISLPAIPSR